MAWVMLFFAGLFEIGWAIGLKYTEGFSRLAPSVLTVAAMAISFYLLSAALRILPAGTATRCGPASGRSARRSWASRG